MTHFDQPRQSRREFLQSGGATVVGLTMASQRQLRAAQSQATTNVRLPLSIHQYSLKPLFDQNQLQTRDYPEFVKQHFGITNVEFAVEFCEELRADPSQAAAIRQKSAELGIRHRTLLCGGDTALDAATENDRRTALKDHLQWAETAQTLGCEFIRVRVSTEGDRDKQLDHATSGISALCDALQKSPLSVLVENIAGFSRDPQWLVELVKRVGPARLGLIADFGNFDGDLYDGMRRLLPYAKSVCTKSWEFDEQGRETKIDFGRMMNVINASRFQGCIAIEYLGDDPLAGVRQTAELITRSR